MPIEYTSSGIVLKHPKGPSAEILLYGATVVSWKVDGEERLFVSSKAALDGSKPVRGGIPVVSPAFGPPSLPEHVKLAQHGFARSQRWKFENIVLDNEAGVSVKLTLDPNEAIRSIYPQSFNLAYVVTLSEHQLSTDIHVKNTSSEILKFQALLHTYFRVPLSQDVLITPLQGLSYYDKTELTEQQRLTPKTEVREQVDIQKPTDSVYENAPGHYSVNWVGGGIGIQTNNFKDVVVWNPQEEGKKIGDMEAGGWNHYVCVEPGHVRGFAAIEPGVTWIGHQVLTVLQN